MRKSQPTPTLVRVGALQDDMTALAGKIVGTLGYGPRFVWVADDGHVYSADPDAGNQVPVSWIVGTFSCGHPLIAIEQDLKVVAQERSKNWIIG